MKSSTVASIFVINMLQGAKDQGYNVRQLLLDNGISPNILEQPKSRITFPQLARLGQSLIELMDDEYCGLLEHPQRQNTYRMACYAALHAMDIGEAVTIMLEFSNLFENSLQYSLIQEEGFTGIRLTRRTGSGIKNNYAIEYILVTIHRTLNWLANAQLRLVRVDLDYPAPSYQSEYRYLFYAAPMSFRQQYSALIFSDSSMRLKNVRKIQELEDFLDQTPITLLSQIVSPPGLSSQVRAWLERQLSEQRCAPGIDSAAAHFRLHPQTLRRHLMKEGVSYKQIKMEARRDLAINLINNQQHNIESIAFLLDFSEPAAFIRAFTSWTGLTPLAYRKMSL